MVCLLLSLKLKVHFLFLYVSRTLHFKPIRRLDFLSRVLKLQACLFPGFCLAGSVPLLTIVSLRLKIIYVIIILLIYVIYTCSRNW